MDIKLADPVLAIVSFIAGTIVPVVYKRVTYEGLSLKQPFDVRGVFEDDAARSRSEIVFSTLVKLANASKDCLIIDEILADSLRTPAAGYEFVGVELKTSKPGEAVHLPPEQGTQDFLPLLIKDTSELVITLGLWFRYTAPFGTRDSTFSPTDDFMSLASGPGVTVRFRMNGKYRRYVLRVKPFKRYEGTGN